MKTLFTFLLFFVVAVSIYANSLHNPFIWDDPYLITNNHYIKSFRYLPDIFKHHLYHSTAGISNFYRPLQTLLLMLDYSIWKDNPLGYHLTSIVNHAVCGFLAFLIIVLVFKRRTVALMVGLLFIVHPANSTVVDYISSRADSQATLFTLLSLWLFLRHIYLPGTVSGKVVRGQNDRTGLFWRPPKNSLRSTLYYVGCLLSFILALLSKELSVIAPLLVLVSVAIAHDTQSARKRLAYRKAIPLFVLLGVYGWLRLTVLSFPTPFSENVPSLSIRLLTSSYSFVKLILLLFAPTEIHIEKNIPYAMGLFEPRILGSLVVLVMVAVFLFWVRSRSRICFFGFIWFFLCLVPMANIVPINATIADHWLYLPSIGFFLGAIGGLADLVGCIGKRAGNLTKALAHGFSGMYGVILIVFSIMTVKQNMVWSEPLGFYQHALRYSPGSFRAHNEIGVIYIDRGEYDKAISEFNKAIENNPHFDQAYDNLGIAYDLRGDYEKAIEVHKKAIELNPQNPKTYNNLGNAYAKIGKYDQAINSYNDALRLNPGYKAVYNNLGVIYYKKGMYEEAIRKWEKALEIDPGFEMAKENIKVARQALEGKK